VLTFFQNAEQSELSALRNLCESVTALEFNPPVSPGKWRNRINSWSQLLFDPAPQFARMYPIHQLRPYLSDLIHTWQPDIIQFEFLCTAPLSIYHNKSPWILTEHNVESLNQFSQATISRKIVRRLMGLFDSWKLRGWESNWLRRCPAIITVSEGDANSIRNLAPASRVYIVPNGVDCQAFAPMGHIQREIDKLLFFGNLGYAPNVSGLLWFVENVLPIIRIHRPNVTLDILGDHSSKELDILRSHSGVNFIGYVQDVRPYLWRSSICVVPLFSGGGTRLKILEAMAAGLPVVSTAIGAEGLDLGPEVDIILAVGTDGFAQAITNLLGDQPRRAGISATARKRVVDLYDWSSIGPKLEKVYFSTLINRREN
jgi:polysaccharide biosynthesis protein PslH